ncbi:MAG: hypothetical protein AVDCRST_MAG30-47 [uncultured Solirubrobacteraceae bacterium]|uniref:Uncharacterized protein n=1 Tax=uncultured Solirubrobacteraceae bacterium TaxID=1162706 RepID=A0A6J4RCF7_9ACTN|nr:MAG: hypothetical protein AVDCRST_MAG30-47 [uncultured Solirubrobacteraceae bacterium]
MDRRSRRREELPEHGGSEVRQDGTGAAGQKRGLLGGERRERRVADRVHAGVHRVEATGAEPAVDRVGGQAGVEELRAGDQTALARRHSGNVTLAHPRGSTVTFTVIWTVNVTVAAVPVSSVTLSVGHPPNDPATRSRVTRPRANRHTPDALLPSMTAVPGRDGAP